MTGLSLAIVGAGIGGLTTALALARQGHRITLVERRTGFTETGAGLQLSPNASRILLDLGLGNALRRVTTEPDGVVIRAISSGREIGAVALGPLMRQRYGAPYWVVHRGDLQRILLDAVRSQPAIRLVMGRNVEEISNGDETSLVLVTANGSREVLSVDGIVGADGLWSNVRAALGRSAPTFAGNVAWRATIESRKLADDLAGNRTGLWLGQRGHVVHYPIAGGSLVNIVAIEKTPAPVDGWAAPGDREILLKHYAGAAPALRALLAEPAEWLCWSLFDQPSRRARALGAGSVAMGRIALVGDAAHPILPFLAQGAALAIEDAATLAGLLASATPDKVPDAFRRYERARRDRVIRVQAEARRNGRIYHASPLISLARNAFIRRLGPARMTSRYDWLYGFKVGE